MTTIHRFCIPFLALCASLAQGAEPASFLGAPDCRIAPLLPRPADDAVTWSGACKDGYADGKGTLAWQAPGKNKRRLDATLVRGEVEGEGTLVYEGGSYIGTFRQGVPHGAGYFKHTNGDGLYEGGVADGLRDGAGVHIGIDRSTYEGQWKAGKRSGHGKAVFALGGSYEGEWLDGRFHGKGKIVYAGSGRSYEGEFRDGHVAGAAAPDKVEPEQFRLRSESPSTGTMMNRDLVIGFAPLDAVWEALTPAQQELVRGNHPALEAGDDPPYPLKGTRALYKAISDVYQYFLGHEGMVLLYVLVGADGTPKTASAFGAPDEKMGRYLMMLAMGQRFKPAVCRGQPCEMIYPAAYQFTTK
jgi:hypothetical protein